MKRQLISILYMTAVVGLLQNCKQEQPDWSGVITFTNPNPQTLAADGYDTINLTAHIQSDSDPDKRAITFTTDNGTFTNGLATITVTADNSGNATTAIKGTVVATATVKATVQTTFVAFKTVNFVAPDPTTIFKINPITGGVPADGVTTVTIGAVVNKALLFTSQSVIFTADGGTFGNGTATITQVVDPSGNAIAYLKSTTFGTYHVSLSNNGVIQTVPVSFVKAVPDFMLLSASTSLASGYANTLAISIALKRNIGTPSPNFLLNYNAVDVNGIGTGIFSSGTASDANGNATVNFTMGNSTYKGPVTITISLQQDPPVESTIIVQII